MTACCDHLSQEDSTVFCDQRFDFPAACRHPDGCAEWVRDMIPTHERALLWDLYVSDPAQANQNDGTDQPIAA
jgi:hypothetical protein